MGITLVASLELKNFHFPTQQPVQTADYKTAFEIEKKLGNTHKIQNFKGLRHSPIWKLRGVPITEQLIKNIGNRIKQMPA